MGWMNGDETLREAVVADADRGLRLDAFLAGQMGIGRRAAARLASRARVNGRRAAKGRVLAAGDVITLPRETPIEAEPETLPTIVRRESDLLVLEKPSGLPSVAIAGHGGPSVAGWLATTHPECAEIGRPGESGLVHRLDNGTSGVLLAARSTDAYDALRSQFDEHRVEKSYLAVVEGHVEAPTEIDAPIGQHRKSRTRVRALGPGSHPRYAVTAARTRVVPLGPVGTGTLIRADTRTGARHQIRVHLAHAGHPLVGDRRYGGRPRDGIDYLLHASGLRWTDPASGALREIIHPAPALWDELATSVDPP